MNWLLLTVLAIVSRAVYGIATKLLSSRIKVSAMTQAVLLTGAAAVLTVALSPLVGNISLANVGTHWLLILIMVFAQAIGNVLFFKGQKYLEASVTQIAFSSILLWSVVLSIALLGSHFNVRQGIGIAVLFVAILLIQYRRGIKRIDPASLYILASALLFALFQVTSAQLAHYLSAGTYLLFAYAGSTLFIFAIYARSVMKDFRTLKVNRYTMMLTTLFASGTSLLYFLFSYFAYQQAPDRGIVVVLLTSQVVLSVVLAIIFLKEHQNMGKKLIAGALAVAAGVLIKS